MSYLWSFTALSASQLCPGSNERRPTIKAKMITLDGKVEHKVKSPPASGTSPEWNYKLFQFPAVNVQGRYQSIKFVIKDSETGEYLGDSKIKWEFIGVPPKEKSYTLRVSPLRKSNLKITGLLRVHTSFQLYSGESSPSPSPSPSPLYTSSPPSSSYLSPSPSPSPSPKRSPSPVRMRKGSEPAYLRQPEPIHISGSKPARPLATSDITGLKQAADKRRIITTSQGSPNERRMSRRPDVAAQKMQQLGSVEFTKAPGSHSEVKLAAGTRMQFSAAGRREILIPTSGQEKFITFGELPTFELIDFDAAAFKKKTGGEKFGFSWNNALWLVTCAVLAYKDEEIVYDVARNVWSMHRAVFLSNLATNTHGFCMHDDRVCVICFRGTECLKDWSKNLKIALISGDFPERYTQEGMKVHQGFHEAIVSVWDQVEDFIETAYARFPNLQLYICGHSLGGALANLCHAFFTLSDKPRKVAAVYTIGQPRVGNRKFKQLLEKSSPNTVYIRLTNNQDIVPNLAPGQHVGTHVHINAFRRLSFKPPAWKKAMNEITSIQGSGKEMSYHGLKDHAGPAYRAIIEENWSRYEVLQKSGESVHSVVDLAETGLLIVDMVTEAVKAVRRYKPQFRAVTTNVIKMKPLIDAATDYVVLMRQDQILKTEKLLKEVNTQLAFLHQEMVHRRKEKSILQRRARHESEFNSKLEKFCITMQNQISLLHDLLVESNKTYNPDVAKRFGFEVTKYNEDNFDIAFHTINFTELSNKALATRRTKDHRADITIMLESAEEMIEEGELAMALSFLNKMPDTIEVKKYMSEEQKATHSFLTAKCHAKLHNHTEAMNALKNLVSCPAATTDLIDDDDFAELATKDKKQFNFIATTLRNVNKSRPPPEYTQKLKKNEIAILSSVFDEYDEEGDGYLTLEQFNHMIDSVGVENLLFQLGWKSPKAVPQIFTIIKTIETEHYGALNLEHYLNLMSTLLPAETANIGSSAARRESQQNRSAVWEMFGGSQ